MRTQQFGGILEFLCDQLNSYRPYLPNWIPLGAEELGDVQEEDANTKPKEDQEG